MEQVKAVSELRRCIAAWRNDGETIAFVPTMGNLHQGHLALVEQAKKIATRVVVSIFVNPMQFSKGGDFDCYPRTLAQDSDALEKCGVDILFSPKTSEMYPTGSGKTTRVEVPGVSDILCGAHRAGHFIGVATVVTKFFNMVQPDIAVFGKKDYQQLHIIKRMIADLAMPIKILGVDTLRESSGLAMSSRNSYLTPKEKQHAALIYQLLLDIAEKIRNGDEDHENLSLYGMKKLKESGFSPDYVEIRRRDNLEKTGQGQTNLVILIAAQLGKARLIDNLEIL